MNTKRGLFTHRVIMIAPSILRKPHYIRDLIICYHYQQAAEKIAKALIVYYKTPGGVSKVHDVDFLLSQVKNLVKKDKGVELTEELVNMASDISIYASEPRYPNEFPADESDVIKARKYCTEIMKWAKDVMNAR